MLLLFNSSTTIYYISPQLINFIENEGKLSISRFNKFYIDDSTDLIYVIDENNTIWPKFEFSVLHRISINLLQMNI